MAPSTRMRSVLTSIASLAALALGSCNSLLDNRPADISADPFATEPSDAAAAPRGAGRNADASVPDPVPDAGLGRGGNPGTDGGGEPPPPQCPVGTKLCGGVCVPTDDPTFGCAGPTCEGCAPGHGAGVCVAGQCALGKCAAGWADCNGLATDGCEVDLSAATSCGACGVACTASPHADSACVAGACSIQCQAGFGDCNHDPADGCETSLLKSRHNCGDCGRLCLVGKCEAGSCVLSL